MIKDNGNRREFESGAVRDIAEGKGRCDLLPLGVIGLLYEGYTREVFINLDKYVRYGNIDKLFETLILFIKCEYGSKGIERGILEVAKHYEVGAMKYDERNWEKGIPLHCYIDSGVRHYLKWLREDTDEPHDRAFVFNILGAIWTHINRPEMIDLPFKKEGEQDVKN